MVNFISLFNNIFAWSIFVQSFAKSGYAVAPRRHMYIREHVFIFLNNVASHAASHVVLKTYQILASDLQPQTKIPINRDTV